MTIVTWMKKRKECDLNVKANMTLTLSYSIVNIQIFRLGEIRSYLTENICHVNFDLEPQT